MKELLLIMSSGKSVWGNITYQQYIIWLQFWHWCWCILFLKKKQKKNMFIYSFIFSRRTFHSYLVGYLHNVNVPHSSFGNRTWKRPVIVHLQGEELFLSVVFWSIWCFFYAQLQPVLFSRSLFLCQYIVLIHLRPCSQHNSALRKATARPFSAVHLFIKVYLFASLYHYRQW